METIDHDYTIHTKQGGGDEKLFVVFRNFYQPNAEKTEAAGRPIFDDAVFIRIVTPGNRDCVIDRPMRPEDQYRFPKQYASFQRGEAEIGDGTRLEEWSMMSRSMVEELRYFGFRTVEHVAQANDGALSKMPGLREWKDRAARFLEVAVGTAVVTKAEAVEKDLRSQIEMLRTQVEQLGKLAKPVEGGTALPTGTKVK